MRLRKEGFFSKNEPRVSSQNEVTHFNSTVEIDRQCGYSENNQSCQLLIDNTTLVLTGPSPFMRADGIEDRYAFNILDIQPQIDILTIMAISISDGLSLKNAMQTKNLTNVIDILRSWGGETCYTASNYLILRFNITDRTIADFYVNDDNENINTTFRP